MPREVYNRPPIRGTEVNSEKGVRPKEGVSSFSKILDRIKGERLKEEIYQSVMESSERHGVPAKLILAVIKQESGFKPHAKSHVGARGLMQLMPATAREMGVKNVHDIRQNIEGGCRYLKKLSDRFRGNVTLILAAYNAGPSNVHKYGGVPPFKETRRYVAQVQAHMREIETSPSIRVAAFEVINSLDLSLTPNFLLREKPSKVKEDLSSIEAIEIQRRRV